MPAGAFCTVQIEKQLMVLTVASIGVAPHEGN